MGDLFHSGTPHEGAIPHSGRHPWGSGKKPFQSDKTGFYAEYKLLKDKGLSQTKIAKHFDEKYYGGKGYFNTTNLRAYITMGKEQTERDNVTTAIKLRNERQMSVKAISEKMGVPERTVYSWLEPDRKERLSKTRAVADAVKSQVDSYAEDGRYLDVGKATELQLGCSRTQLNAAIAMLEDEGYKKQYLSVTQLGTHKKTSVIVLTKDDVPYSEVYKNMDKVTPVEGIQPAKDTKYFEPIGKPVSISSDRIMINYAEDGGIKKDGVIEIRPGVEDLSLGENNYAQVRIAVDGDHYLKGMAIYSNDIPDGVDIIFNTNKTKDVDKMKVLKSMEKIKKNGEETDEIDWDKPFGATVKRAETYVDSNGKEKQSAVNIVNADEEWDKWSKNLASQFLSKQYLSTAKQQLQLAYDAKESEYESYDAITNPTLKKKLLNEFADSCDSAAVTLKAAPFYRQATHVLLPLTKIKDDEVYAPNYNTGEEVALVRYPHGGVFEIPVLKVNNNNKQGKELLGQAKNAIGISSAVAEQLSGADFDGDTAVVIPTKNLHLKTSKPLKELEDFDPKIDYKRSKDDTEKTGPATGFRKQQEMGKVSNLITDMTLGGANESEIARAVKHSMVVIDAEKHNLDWRKSYKDNDIASLKEKYQGGKNNGASTLISKAKSEDRPHTRKEVTSANDKEITEQQRQDFLSGKKVYKYTNETYLKSTPSPQTMTEKQLAYYKKAKAQYNTDGTIPENKDGVKFKVEYRTVKSTKMAETDDAFTLSSGTQMENTYATHANKLKALANKARKEALETEPIKYSPSAKKVYAEEVESLNKKLKTAQLNNPLERQAQMIANKIVASKVQEDPDLKYDKDAYKKVENRALSKARATVGAKKEEIKITEKEWEAIQAGAVSASKQTQIFANTNDEALKKLATPKKEMGLSNAQASRAKRLLNAGWPQSEVAESLGVSVSTLKKYVKF